MLTRLDRETRPLHPEADALWVDLLSPAPTLDQYSAVLVAAYGFAAPVEAALALTPGVNAALPLRPRARTGLLVQDLLTLGLSPAAIARLPQCSQIVPFRDVAEALGWLYVIERATLLHGTVRHHLELALPRASAAICFLRAYDGHTEMRWQELGTALDRVATSQDIEDQIIAASRDAFATQRYWLHADASHAVHA
jgi:heme oxygenase